MDDQKRKEFKLAVHNSISNTLAGRQVSLNRELMAMGGSGYGLDTKRRGAWCEYGWPETVSYNDMYRLYRRTGLAHGVIKKIINTCWRSYPEIIQGMPDDKSKNVTPWERKSEPVLKSTRMWKAFKVADQRRLVGAWSAIILRLKDSKTLDQPVTASAPVVEEYVPVWRGDLTWNNDSGLWTYKVDDTKIHPDRIFILGDYDEVEPFFLEPAYNNFNSIEKVEGGSGESFLKNAARQIAINYDKDTDLQALASAYGATPAELQEVVNEAATDLNAGMDKVLMTQGATVSPLVASIPDPTPTYNINLQTISAALNIPSKILVGMQTGERASTEDRAEFNDVCQGRRDMDLSDEIKDFIEHLMRIRVLQRRTDYSVIWSDLNESTLTDRLANSKVMNDMPGVFDEDEIRQVAGYDPRNDDALGEDEEDDDGDQAE